MTHNNALGAGVLDAESWAQVAELVGKIEPAVFGGFLADLAKQYNGAAVLPERNNHGHLLIRTLVERGGQLLSGYDGKPGCLTNVKGKPLAYG